MAGRRVLVAYASRHGSTQGIADRIAARLREHGHEVDLRPVAEASEPDRYDAVVFGSPVYDQSWPPEAVAFVRDNRTALAALPVWLFSVGSFGDTKRVIGRVVKGEPKDIAETRDAIRPRDYRVFAGVIEKGQWPRIPSLLFRVLGGRMGDNRDWDEIDRWAGAIARELPGQEERGPAPVR